MSLASKARSCELRMVNIMGGDDVDGRVQTHCSFVPYVARKILLISEDAESHPSAGL